MPLSAYVPAVEKVEHPGVDFVVRGLAPDDIAVLVREHYDTAKTIFDTYVTEAAIESLDQVLNGEDQIGLDNIKGVVMQAVGEIPAFMAHAIALAADEPESRHQARTLPTVVQIDAISKIVTLTLEAEGGLEKLMESVVKIAGTVTGLAASRSP